MKLLYCLFIPHFRLIRVVASWMGGSGSCGTLVPEDHTVLLPWRSTWPLVKHLSLMTLHTDPSAMSMTLILMEKQAPNGKLWNGIWFRGDHPDGPRMKTEHWRLLMELIDPQECAHTPNLKITTGERIRKKRRLLSGHRHSAWRCPLLTCGNSVGRLQ